MKECNNTRLGAFGALGMGGAGRRRRGSPAGAAAAVALAGIALVSGCAGTVGVDGVLVAGHPAVRAEIVPVEITAYPRVYYRGTYAYLVGGVWYYPTDRGWVVFEEEPRELRRYRQQHRQSPRYVPPEREHSYPRERGRRYYTPR